MQHTADTLPQARLALLVFPDPQAGEMLARLARPYAAEIRLCQTRAEALPHLDNSQLDLALVDETLQTGDDGLDFAAEVLNQHPAAVVVITARRADVRQLQRALRTGISDVLVPPLKPEQLREALQAGLARAARRNAAAAPQPPGASTDALNRTGRDITRQLDLDEALSAVVNAAVEQTGADEGSLMLLDERSGELYIRAQRNWQEDAARTFRLKVQDSLAGQVLQSGQPYLLESDTPHKIKTTYLVRSLIYVPVIINNQPAGLLSAVNRVSTQSFRDEHVKQLATLAGYAAVAIENATRYTQLLAVRNQVEKVLSRIPNGVIVLNNEQRTLLINRAARTILGRSGEENLIGKPYQDLLQHPALIELARAGLEGTPGQAEVALPDDAVYDTRTMPIAGVGLAITLHDITHLKRLDRIKNEFVSTVSHDLRTPLTSILGFTDLIQRAGPVNDLQSDFIRRVKNSVTGMTRLMDDLLIIGRIESGVDSRREPIMLDQALHNITIALENRLAEKQITLHQQIEADLSLQANPPHLKHMIARLLEYAVRHTPPGGSIDLHAQRQAQHITVQVCDSGPAITPQNLARVFERFFRARQSRAEDEDSYALGLAAVKAVAESLGGRVWADSPVQRHTAQGEDSGVTLTIELPAAVSNPP